MNKPKFLTYAQKGKNDNFMEYYKGLNRKDACKLIKTLKMIEEFGPLEAHKQRWIDTARKKTDLLEVRSHVNKDQKRGICFLDKDRNAYILIYGFDKKQNKIKNSTLNTCLDIKKLYFEDQKRKLNRPKYNKDKEGGDILEY